MAGATPGRLQGCGGPCWSGGYSGIRFHRAGTNPPEWKSSCPGGRGLSRCPGGRGCPRRCSRARSPRARSPQSAPRTPLLPRAWRADRLHRVFSLIFTAGHFKKSLAIPRVALFVSYELFFYFFFNRGAKPRNYFLAILHRGRENTLQVFSLN